MPEDEEEEEGGEGGTYSAAAVDLLQCPFRSPREAVAFVFHERERRGTSGGRGKDSIPAKFGAGRLGIVGGLPQAWPNVSWHCCPIPRADIETIQTAEFEPI